MIACTVAGLGIVWLIAMNLVLYLGTAEPSYVAEIQTINWLVVLGSSVAVYLLARRAAVRVMRARGVLAAVVDSIGDGLMVLGSDRNVVFVNRAAVHMLECESASELVGMSAQQFSKRFLITYPNGSVVKPEGLASQLAFSEPGAVRFKAFVYPVPKHELVVETTASGVREHSEDPADLVVAVLHDITDTENLERTRYHFFAAAAHALKTPIAIIKANVQLMGRGTVATRDSRLAVQRQCDRIDRVVQNLLVVSRARSHALQLHVRRIELAPIVQLVANDLSTSTREIRMEILPTPSIYADPERITTLVRNLAYDALDLSQPHSPIVLRLSTHDGWAELGVVYQPLATLDRMLAYMDEYDDGKLSRCATETIAHAHAGELGEDPLDDEVLRSVRLPVPEVR